jgi:polyhydroxyalkanoate synthase
MLMAKRDHLVPPSSTEGIRARVASRDVESVVFDAGHVGLIVGSKAQQTLWPEATRWLAERSTSPRAHPS